MNIIHTVSGLAPEFGGPARSVPALCSELAALGNDVAVVYLDFGNEFGIPQLPQHPNLIYRKLPVKIRAGMRPVWIPGFHSALLELGAGKPQLVFHDHGVWLPHSGLVLKAARRLDAKVITTTRGMLEPWALGYKQLRKMLAWSLYQKGRLNQNAVLQATSFSEAENLRQLQLTPPIAVIPNGTEIPILPGNEVQQEKDQNTLLFLSRIHPKKGLINLVEAIKILKPNRWKVTIAGYDEGGHQAVVEKAVRDLGVERYFRFLGPVDDSRKWDLYRKADVFILPSFSENFGLVIAEALASGTPVITTRGTPWKDLVDYNCGWWIEPTQEDLISCLRRVFTLDLAMLREMGERGRSLVKEKYSWPAAARKLDEVYRWMLDIREQPPDTII